MVNTVNTLDDIYTQLEYIYSVNSYEVYLLACFLGVILCSLVFIGIKINRR